MRRHFYKLEINWKGNDKGTENYSSYSRNFQLTGFNKPVIEASADDAFLGDKSKYNPEELFLSAVSSCHMLWYLHICSENGINVLSYRDFPEGDMEEDENGGRFIHMHLYPVVIVSTDSDIKLANKLHEIAHQKCFIANSCNFPISFNPLVSAY